jgi:hypothetical protein
MINGHLSYGLVMINNGHTTGDLVVVHYHS